MTLPASGQLAFSEIQTEFGGSNPISMSEYYGQAGLPASGQIAVSNFHGKSAGVQIGMTVGTISTGGAFTDFTGYGDGSYGFAAFGALTSGLANLPPGVVIESIAIYTPSANPSLRTHEIRLKGFGADPGASFLKSCQVGSVSKAFGSATYQYFSATGRAIWSWANQSSPFWDLVNGTTRTAILVF